MSDLGEISEAIASTLQNVLDCNCAHCDGRPLVPSVAKKIRDAWERRLVLVSSAIGQEGVKPDNGITREAVHALRILARATEPLQGIVFQQALGIDERSVKALMRSLRDEWLLPLTATRQKPFGYGIATTTDQLLEWGRITRAQAISELAVWYRVYRANAPELAGQQSLDFVSQISTELQEAIG
jgi:hypothetical protein